jgi:RNA polymerase sigma-70 factor (ECF subfamily)
MAAAESFVELADPYRPELLAHCYRILGSVDDAEDLVQETYLRAWRGYDGFEGRSTLRAWLYRIATTACLSALEHRSRRFLPSGLGAPSDNPHQPLDFGQPQLPWVQPMPDSLLVGSAADPAAIAVSRSSVRLALVAALQHLPARQRVVLILRDVLAWRAAEVAELLETSSAAVNSILQRARAQLELVAPDEDAPQGPLDARHRDLLDRYVRAFEACDIEALLKLLRAEVTLEMPPEVTWFAGRAAVGGFIAEKIFRGPGAMRLFPSAANDQPALAVYHLGQDGRLHAHALQVLTLREGEVAAITAFRQPTLFPLFGLRPVLDDVATPAIK